MIYVILGQTASGKTTLATKIARTLNIPLINADAYQCYAELNIGTAKSTKDELEGIEFYFIGDRSIEDPIDVKIFQTEGRKIIDKLIKENKDIIVCGGTNLYIRALLFDYQFPEISKEIRDYVSSMKLDEQVKMLQEKDVDTFNNIDKNNQRRVKTALCLALSQQSRNKIEKQNSGEPIYPCVFFNIDIDSDILKEKINKRVEQMFASGLVDEIININKNHSLDLKSLNAIGYAEFRPYADKLDRLSDEDIEKIKEDIKANTRQYAKKQRTFIRHQYNNVITCKALEIEKYIHNDFGIKTRTRLLLNNTILNDIERLNILVVGIGGVGSLISNYLVRLGVKHITIIDGDTVNITNLNRQMMYDLFDIDRLKVEALKDKLYRVNPLANIIPIARRINSESDLPSQQFDFIFDCIDDANAKTLLASKAYFEKSKIFISAGLGKRTDSTNVKYGSIISRVDPLIRKVKELLADNIAKWYFEQDFIFSVEKRAKSFTNLVSSVCTVPNAGGLAMISAFLNEMKRRHNYE